MSRTLNLASRPLRNEALPLLLVQVSCLLVLAITLKHALVVRTLLPDRTTAVNQEVATLEKEVARLRAEGNGLVRPTPEPKAVAQWALLKELVDKRTFSWTDLLARLEEIMPRGARLVSVQPSINKGQMVLDLTAIARSSKDGLDFSEVLEKDPAFADVYPLSKQNSGNELEFRYTMHYRAEALKMPRAASGPESPSPVASPGASPAASPDTDSDDDDF